VGIGKRRFSENWRKVWMFDISMDSDGVWSGDMEWVGKKVKR